LETRGIAAHKLELIEEKIADLSKIKKSIARLVRACDASSDGARPVQSFTSWPMIN
jgi:MerR family mercuric resistance operon transcriptional regulator